MSVVSTVPQRSAAATQTTPAALGGRVGRNHHYDSAGEIRVAPARDPSAGDRCLPKCNFPLIRNLLVLLASCITRRRRGNLSKLLSIALHRIVFNAILKVGLRTFKWVILWSDPV